MLLLDIVSLGARGSCATRHLVCWYVERKPRKTKTVTFQENGLDACTSRLLRPWYVLTLPLPRRCVPSHRRSGDLATILLLAEPESPLRLFPVCFLSWCSRPRSYSSKILIQPNVAGSSLGVWWLAFQLPPVGDLVDRVGLCLASTVISSCALCV